MVRKIIGLIVITIGIVFLGNSMDWWQIDIFFEGFWTLFIIIPSILSLAQKQWVGGLTGLCIGVFFLLAAQDIISYEVILPAIIIAVGISLLFNPSIKNVASAIKGDYFAIFSGNEDKIMGEFNGTQMTSIFGGVDLDLRDAIIMPGANINCTCIFGGNEIILPSDVGAKVKGVPVFGSVENKSNTHSEKFATIDCLCVFGSVTIR